MSCKFTYELELWNQGISNVAGADEVGRGPLAGPLVAAAVVWRPEIATWERHEHKHFNLLSQITDSKKLASKKRNVLADFIMRHCKRYAIIKVSSQDIDNNGVGEANKSALRMAVLKLHNVHHALIDHYQVFEGEDIPETSITKGDEKSISIASASIIAKEYRDRLMREKYHKMYPQYGFNTNVGYGTKAHIEAIRKYGLCPIHRRSFSISPQAAKQSQDTG